MTAYGTPGAPTVGAAIRSAGHFVLHIGEMLLAKYAG